MPAERIPFLCPASASAAAAVAHSAMAPAQAATQMNGKWGATTLSEESEGLDGRNVDRSTAGRTARKNVVMALTPFDTNSALTIETITFN